MKRRPRKLNVFVAGLIFFGGFFLAAALPPAVSEYAVKLQNQLTLVGLLLLLCLPFYRSAVLAPVLNEHHHPELKRQDLSFLRYLLNLFVLQGAFFYISLFFFYTLEAMTRWNSRLQPLKEGQIFEILHVNFFELGFLPWVLYGVLGVGLAYFMYCKSRYPTLSKIIFPKPTKPWQWFLHNYLEVGVDAVMFAPFVWLLPIGIIWLCEGLNALYDQPSLFTFPLRSIFILGVLCLYFNRSHRRFLDLMEKIKANMGIILVIYLLLGALFIFLFHVIIGWFQASLGNPEVQMTKSVIGQILTEDAQDRRLGILVWSWWALWLPWMASQIAKCSQGRKLWVACLCSLIFPSLLWLSFEQGGGLFHYEILNRVVQLPIAKFFIGFCILSFLYFFFRDVYTVQDFARGGMQVLGHRKRVYSLKKWMSGLFMLMMGHMVAFFMMGWISVQIISTLGALVMVTALFGFIWTLLASRELLSVVEKYKVLGRPEA